MQIIPGCVGPINNHNMIDTRGGGHYIPLVYKRFHFPPTNNNGEHMENPKVARNITNKYTSTNLPSWVTHRCTYHPGQVLLTEEGRCPPHRVERAYRIHHAALPILPCCTACNPANRPTVRPPHPRPQGRSPQRCWHHYKDLH